MRLESMGALTQGDRRAAAGASDMKDFNLDTKWGHQALEIMMSSLSQHASRGAAALSVQFACINAGAVLDTPC